MHDPDREDAALDALIVLALRTPPDFDQDDLESLPELTLEDRAALDSLGPDFIDRLLKGERPLSTCRRPDTEGSVGHTEA